MWRFQSLTPEHLAAMDEETKLCFLMMARQLEAQRAMELCGVMGIIFGSDREAQQENLTKLAQAAYRDNPEMLNSMIESITRMRTK